MTNGSQDGRYAWARSYGCTVAGRGLCVAAAFALSACGADTSGGPETSHIVGVPDSVTIFAPRIISSTAPEFATTFSLDGSVVYFDRMTPDRQQVKLYESRYADGQWGEPTVVSFAGPTRDVDPFITPDGRRLYFSSTRPLTPGDTTGDYNTWYVERSGDGWSEPVALDAPLNTDSQEVFASVDAAGNLYFSSDRGGVQRIYVSIFRDGAFATPKPVDFDVNLGQGAGNPLVSRDGNMLIFVAVPPGGRGGADLHATCRRDGKWSPARNLGPKVNSAFADFAPSITPDGRYLVFTSERPGVAGRIGADERPPGDLYVIELSGVDAACHG